MNQQINLYQPIFRKQVKVFSATTILQIAGIFMLALLLIYIYSLWQATLLDRQITQLQAALQSGTARLAQLESTLPSHTIDPALQAALKAAVAQHDLMQLTVVALSQRSYGITAGFSSQLVGLARQHVNGLWLTAVRLSKGGADFDLSGKTVDPRLVPEYVQRLSAVPVFKGTEFGLLRIERPEKNDRALSFRLSTALSDNSDKESGNAPVH